MGTISVAGHSGGSRVTGSSHSASGTCAGCAWKTLPENQGRKRGFGDPCVQPGTRRQFLEPESERNEMALAGSRLALGLVREADIECGHGRHRSHPGFTESPEAAVVATALDCDSERDFHVRILLYA